MFSELGSKTSQKTQSGKYEGQDGISGDGKDLY